MGRVIEGSLRSRGARAVMVLAVTVGSACTSSPGGVAQEIGGIHIDQIELPPDFGMELVTENVPGARSLAMSPNGVLYVGTRPEGTVYAVEGVLGQNPATVTIIGSGLMVPNGVAWHEGSLYVAEKTRILRFDDIDSRIDDPPVPVVVAEGFPEEEVHGWRFIRFGPDDHLYVPIGAPCNICEAENPIYGSITRVDPASGELEIMAAGIRNTVGFDWHPETDELWFTDNGADGLGDNRPSDELNRVSELGLHFGHPYCLGGDLLAPDLGEERSCAEFVPPVIQLGPHVAALGMRFYTGDSFPSELHGQIFIAEHGSSDRDEPIGYRITLVRLERGRAVEYSVFAEGWLNGDQAWGRPVDVEVAVDGSLLVSDDRAGAIYRIMYQPGS